MSELKCGLCGAELLPATSFCRQCGSAISDVDVQKSEATTAILGNAPGSATTQRLDPRPTSPERGLHNPVGVISVGAASRGRRKAVVGGFILILIVVGVLTVVAVMRIRNANPTLDTSLLIYPGAQTVVDMPNTDGSRAIQLQTKEPLARVENWYQ